MFSTLGLGIASVALNLILGDWNIFVDLMGQLLGGIPVRTPSQLVHFSRVSDGFLVLASIASQLIARRKLASESRLVHVLSVTAIFLIFLAMLLTKHIAVVSYYFVRPGLWF